MDAANSGGSGKRGRGRPKGSGGKRETVPAKGQEKLTALVAFVFQWVSEMLAQILEIPELGLSEVQTDDSTALSEADVLAVYPTRYLLKTALGKQAAKLAADDDLVKTLVILANYSLRVVPAVMKKASDVSNSRPAREIGGPASAPADAGNGPPVVGPTAATNGAAPTGSGLSWRGFIPGQARTDTYGPSPNGKVDSIPVPHHRGP